MQGVLQAYLDRRTACRRYLNRAQGPVTLCRRGPANQLMSLLPGQRSTIRSRGISGAMRSGISTLICIGLLQLAGLDLASALSIKLEGSCSYFGETLPIKAEVLSSNDNVSALIQRIVDASGLSRNFEVRAALVPNATAVTLGATRYILYNPGFMDGIAAATHDRWAAASILAHEIGHHLNGHTLQSGGSRPPLELEADYFSGFILQKLGAPLDDATAVVEKYAPEAASTTHPGRRERVASITSGWAAACQKDPDCPKDAISQGELLRDDDQGAIAPTTSDAEQRRKTLMREAQ